MKYNFDKIIDRQGTDSVKYDLRETLFGKADILPMWVADMDFEVPEFIREAIISRARHPVYGYTFRPERFFKVVADWMERRHQWHVDPTTIGFSPGIVPALNMTVLALTSPGDQVVVQPPVYFPFFTAVENHGRKLIYNQLIETNGVYSMDFDALEDAFRDGARFMFFCHPHNPVGRCWNRKELETLAGLCVTYGVTIVSDEIHSDLLLFGHRHIPLASLGDGIAEQTITCVAPSKTFNLAGLHSSAMIIQNRDLKKKYDTILDHLHIGGGNLFGQVAMEAAYEQGEEWLDQLIEYLEGNFNLLKQLLSARVPEITVSPLEATYLAWIGMRHLDMKDEALSKLLVEEAGIGLVDGPRFGPGGSGFQRMNIALPRRQLEQAVMQLADTLIERS
jgi:cystathionine beta-lyase